MKEKSIFKQLLIPMITIVTVLALVLTTAIVFTVSKSFEKEVLRRNSDKSQLVAGEISAFMDGAYSMTEEMSKNPSILTMETDVQTPILEDCVARNNYLELLYIQDAKGMQTGRSSGKLADRSTRWWFVQMLEEKQAFVSKSYYSVNTGMPCASIFFPMAENNKFVGVFAVDIKLDYLQSVIEEFSDKKNGEYSFIIDGEGVVVAHPDSVQIEELYNYVNYTKTVSKKDASGNVATDANGNILTEEQEIKISKGFKTAIADVMSGKSNSVKTNVDGTSCYVTYAPIALKGNSDSWSVITVQKVSSAMGMVYGIIAISVIIALIMIAVVAYIITRLAHKITEPILDLTDLVVAASNGDFSKKADENSNNELGTLAKGFNKMSQQISATLTDMNSFGTEVVQSSGRLLEIESKADAVNDAVGEIKNGTARQNVEVNDVVGRVSVLNEKFAELKQQSQHLLSNVEQTVSSEQAGTESVRELEEQNALTTKMISESYSKIVALEEQSKKISGIVETINEISSQTSLLALNASIEAARAGEQGRGFSVVAESIGKLANDSSDATASIDSIINDLCADIESTVKDIQAINKLIASQNEAVDKVQGTFDDFRVLARSTKDAMTGIEALVAEMNDICKAMVDSVEAIRDISKNTEGITEDVSKELTAQLEAIQHVSRKVNDLAKVTTLK